MKVMGAIMVAAVAAMLVAGAFCLAQILEDEDFELDAEVENDGAPA
jgi:hypothetical protein